MEVEKLLDRLDAVIKKEIEEFNTNNEIVVFELFIGGQTEDNQLKILNTCGVIDFLKEEHRKELIEILDEAIVEMVNVKIDKISEPPFSS